MTDDEGTNDEDIVTYDETTHKQARKDYLVGALMLLGLALLCIIIIVFWITGYRTPQTATFKDWFVLVGASVMLIGILFFVSLVAYAVLKNRRVRIQKKLVRAREKTEEIVGLFAFSE